MHQWHGAGLDAFSEHVGVGRWHEVGVGAGTAKNQLASTVRAYPMVCYSVARASVYCVPKASSLDISNPTGQTSRSITPSWPRRQQGPRRREGGGVRKMSGQRVAIGQSYNDAMCEAPGSVREIRPAFQILNHGDATFQ